MTAPAESPYGPHAMPLGRGVKMFFGFLAVLGLVAAGAGIASVVNDQSQARSDEITACRSSYNIELNAAPVAKALKALAAHGIESDQFQAATERIDEDRLAELARLSRIDSDAFLRECRSG